jgi:hypothetical protein
MYQVPSSIVIYERRLPMALDLLGCCDESGCCGDDCC